MRGLPGFPAKRFRQRHDPRGGEDGPWLSGQIHLGIDEQLRLPPIQRANRYHVHLDFPLAFLLVLLSKKVCKFADHFGITCHFVKLPVRQVWFEVGGMLFACCGVNHHKLHARFFGAQHHLPGEAMTLLGPQNVSGIEKTTKGEEQVKARVKQQSGQNKFLPDGQRW